MRAHLARAVALDPVLLVIEHPTADVPAPAHAALAADIARVSNGRGLATVIVTMDEKFASAAAGRVLTLRAADGELRAQRRGWFR